MPRLKNPKHETFCQGLVEGKATSQAYVDAGYPHNTGNASALAKRPNIIKRVEELRKDLQRNLIPESFDPAVVDREFIISELYAQVRLARDTGELKVANEALTLMGKIVGVLADGSGNKAKIAPGEKVERVQTITANAQEVSEVNRFIERLSNAFGDEPEDGDTPADNDADDTDGDDADK